MMSGQAAKKGERRKGAKDHIRGQPTPTLPVLEKPPRAPAVEGAAVDGNDADGTKSGKKKSKRKRERHQIQEKDGRSGGVVGGPGASATSHDEDTTRTTKRRKKGGKRRPSSQETAAIATAAAGTPGAAAAGSYVSTCPSALDCTSKVGEYDALLCDAREVAEGANIEKKMEEKKRQKKKKSRGGKRQRTGDASSQRSNGDAPPLAEEERTLGTSSNEVDGGGGEACSDNNDDDDDHESQTLEGILLDGAMYLVDAHRRVFSALRDERGDLVEVGTFDDDRGTVVMIDKPPSGAPSDGKVSRSEKGKQEEVKSKHGNAGVSTAVPSSTAMKTKEKELGARVRRGGDDNAPDSKTENVVDYPFEVEECDHCETSERAYADIVPLLSALAERLGKTPQELMIYDPYYCQGSTVARLGSLGFPNVYNRKEDFYHMMKLGAIPEHDVVVTNPPFSGNHVPKILSFCARRGAKPWFLLLPNYVYLKDYYEPSLGRGTGRGATLPFYLTPPKRYTYYSPAGSRLKVKSSDRKTSPFNTFWYIHLGDGGVTSKILQSYDATSRKAEVSSRCCVARTSQQIPYKMMDSNDPRRKKARDRQRSIDRIRKKKSEWVVG